jgi:hypothetical protein
MSGTEGRPGKGGAKMRAGQALRGSSEFLAWGDSNLYLRRHGDQLTLSVEHRAAASISTIQMLLDTTDDAVAFRTLDHAASAAEPATTVPAAAELNLEQRLVEHLIAA